MGFFDKLGKTINDVSQSTIQKGKDAASIAKITVQINDEKKKVSDVYKRLGEAYCSLHSEDAEPALAPFIDELKTIDTTIAALEAEINKVKGLIICTNCGQGVSLDASFCPKCGAKIEKPVEPEPEVVEAEYIERIYCKSCGSEIEEGSSFCTNCGLPLETIFNDDAEVEVNNIVNPTTDIDRFAEMDEIDRAANDIIQ